MSEEADNPVAMRAIEEEWAEMMRAAMSGDSNAYKVFLEAVSPVLRAAARRHFARFGQTGSDAEDVVQETLLAIHLKRHTWDARRPIRPWIAAIARHKLIDALRRRGHRVEVQIDDLDIAQDPDDCADPLDRYEIDRMLENLSERQRDIVSSLSLNGASVRDTARRLAMSEGAVRVSLHRALAALAALYRNDRK
jgi:RNA polymerase sigma-70 factor (ECF subfamily)